MKSLEDALNEAGWEEVPEAVAPDLSSVRVIRPLKQPEKHYKARYHLEFYTFDRDYLIQESNDYTLIQAKLVAAAIERVVIYLMLPKNKQSSADLTLLTDDLTKARNSMGSV